MDSLAKGSIKGKENKIRLLAYLFSDLKNGIHGCFCMANGSAIATATVELTIHSDEQ